jgi:mRNA interferase MazF
VVVTRSPSVRRGDIWWIETAEEGGRPFLVATRNAAIDVLGRVLAVPITHTVRGIPTELRLGPDNGLPVECVASCDNIRPVSKSLMTRRLGWLQPEREHELCAAIRAATGC